MTTKPTCPKCGYNLSLEPDKELKKKYKYLCTGCDENYFNFEAVQTKDN